MTKHLWDGEKPLPDNFEDFVWIITPDQRGFELCWGLKGFGGDKENTTASVPSPEKAVLTDTDTTDSV